MKQSSVLADHKQQLATLRLNFMRNLQDYNTIQAQLRARDKARDQFDKMSEKIRKIHQEKGNPDN
jgi:hypothetical protein